MSHVDNMLSKVRAISDACKQLMDELESYKLVPKKGDGTGLEDIIEQVCDECMLPPHMLLNRRLRSRSVIRGRWEIMRRARARGMSLPEIGRALGMHHTSVLHALRKAETQW